MKALTVITDPVYKEPAGFTAYEKFWLKYIQDKRYNIIKSYKLQYGGPDRIRTGDLLRDREAC